MNELAKCILLTAVYMNGRRRGWFEGALEMGIVLNDGYGKGCTICGPVRVCESCWSSRVDEGHERTR